MSPIEYLGNLILLIVGGSSFSRTEISCFCIFRRKEFAISSLMLTENPSQRRTIHEAFQLSNFGVTSRPLFEKVATVAARSRARHDEKITEAVDQAGVMKSQVGPLARISRLSSVAKGQPKASANATYQAS